MSNIILLFDKKIIEKDEIKERVDYYVSMSDKAFEFLEKNDKRSAMKILKEIRVSMKNELDYYKKSNVKKYIDSNQMYTAYFDALNEAFVKQIRTNAYETLSNNLYDVNDYMRNYEMRMTLIKE